MSAMTRRHTMLISALAALVALIASACEPPPPQAPPVPDRVAMAGDSIGWQALLYSGTANIINGYDTTDKLYPGWRAQNAQPRVSQDVQGATTSPDVLVIEFGHNYITWGDAQRNELSALAFTPHPDTCVVLVKPHIAPQNTNKTTLNGYRAHVDAIAATRANTVVVDATSVLGVHPEYLDEDGIHLEVPPWDYGVPDQPSAVAFAQMIAAGVAACP